MVQRVGIIGGGQLAWMMAPGAKALGLKLVVQTPGLQDPAVKIADQVVQGAIADAATTARLATHCDVITFENEFVDLPALRQLAAQGVIFYPPLTALAPILDKWDQRTAFEQWGVPTPSFAAVTAHSTAETLSQFGFPVVLKARRHGYDGQGTFVIPDVATLQQTLVGAAPDQWLLEEFVPFERELAIMAARSSAATGHQTVVYPLVETQQVNQVCQRVFVLPEWKSSVVSEAGAIAHTILEKLDYVGVLGIELFLTAAGQLSVNELAPRTHNSGHYTLDACHTSQFEQQLRAVSDLPLGDPALHCAGAVMVNLLGFESATSDYAEKQALLRQVPEAQVYWYGKGEARVGRKLGHVTVPLHTGQGRPEAEAIAQQIEQIW